MLFDYPRYIYSLWGNTFKIRCASIKLMRCLIDVLVKRTTDKHLPVVAHIEDHTHRVLIKRGSLCIDNAISRPLFRTSCHTD